MLPNVSLLLFLLEITYIKTLQSNTKGMEPTSTCWTVGYNHP